MTTAPLRVCSRALTAPVDMYDPLPQVLVARPDAVSYEARTGPISGSTARAGRQTAAMKLAGWNDIPWGYAARFDTASAPVWLRILYATPFLDRFAYPQLVSRGLGFSRVTRACRRPSWTRSQGAGHSRIPTTSHPVQLPGCIPTETSSGSASVSHDHDLAMPRPAAQGSPD